MPKYNIIHTIFPNETTSRYWNRTGWTDQLKSATLFTDSDAETIVSQMVKDGIKAYIARVKKGVSQS